MFVGEQGVGRGDAAKPPGAPGIAGEPRPRRARRRLPPRHGRSHHRGEPGELSRQCRPGGRPLGRADEHPDVSPLHGARAARGQPGGERACPGVGLVVALAISRVGARMAGRVGGRGAGRGGDEHGGQPAGQPHAAGTGDLRDRPAGRAGQQHLAQPVPQPLQFTGRGVLLGRVALGGGRGDAVDVGEHHLGEGHQRRAVQPAAAGRRLPEAAPGDAGAHPVGAQQVVQRPSRVHLAAAETDIDLPAGGEVESAVGTGLDQAEEAEQRLVDSAAHLMAELAFQRARVGGNLPGDRGDDLFTQSVELGGEDLAQPGWKLSHGNSLPPDSRNLPHLVLWAGRPWSSGRGRP